MADMNMHIDYNFEILDEYENEDIIPQALIKIAPFITSIDSMTFPESDLLEMVYDNDDEDEADKSQLLLKEMMDKTRILSTDRLYIFL
jgi:hypothetical protein